MLCLFAVSVAVVSSLNRCEYALGRHSSSRFGGKVKRASLTYAGATTALALVAGICLVGSPAVAAPMVALPNSSGITVSDVDENAIADLVAKVAPLQGAVIPSTTAGALSTNPADSVTIPGEDGASLGVRLPSEVTVGESAISSDGTVVYGGIGDEAVDVAVQALDSGAVRIQTIINAPSSPHEFSYGLEDGFQVAEAADGSIWAVGFTEAGDFQAYSVGKAWARDANGAEVDTHYELRGSELTQVVSPTEATVYPIVADPTWQWYNAAYGAGLSKSETRDAAGQSLGGFCSVLPSAVRTVCKGFASYWRIQAQQARDAGGCVFYAAAPAPLAMRWVSPECR